MSRAIYIGPWRVDLTVRDRVRSPVAAVSLARAIAAGLDAAGAPSPGSIGLILSDDTELAMLNEAHLGGSGPTDVLSFPLLPPSSYPHHPPEADADAGKGRGAAVGPDAEAVTVPDFTLPPGRRRHLGDIVVSVERATEQAERGRGGQTGDIAWAASDELRLLVTHGALHICGWDHAKPDEETAMRAFEQRLLGPIADPGPGPSAQRSSAG